MITIENLTLSLQGKKILNNISLQLKTGTINCLIGGSGEGKTTLLKSIAGLLSIESGSITVDEKKHCPTLFIKACRNCWLCFSKF